MYEDKKYNTDATGALETLRRYGVAVIPGVLGADECRSMLAGVWDFFEELTSGFDVPLDRDKKETWRSFYDLIPSHGMLMQSWGVGHAGVSWQLRQNPAIISIFSELWKCKAEDLLVSFDGLSFSLPPEVTNRGWGGTSWLHTDQSLRRNGEECFQSWVTAMPVEEGDATLAFLEGSHAHHAALAERFGSGTPKDWVKLTDEQIAFLKNRGCEHKKIACPAGSLVLWDSRTIHCGAGPEHGRKTPNLRAVVYLFYTERKRATATALVRKRRAFDKGRTTSHWPHIPRMFGKTPQLYGKAPPKVTLPKQVALTALGRRLAGFEN